MNQTSDFPRGWDEKRVRKVLDHYEGLSDDEQLAEDEAAYKDANYTMMQVPNEFVGAVRALLAQHTQ